MLLSRHPVAHRRGQHLDPARRPPQRLRGAAQVLEGGLPLQAQERGRRHRLGGSGGGGGGEGGGYSVDCAMRRLKKKKMFGL